MGEVINTLVFGVTILLCIVGMMVGVAAAVSINYPEPERTALAALGVAVYAVALITLILVTIEAIKYGRKHYTQHGPDYYA